MKKRIVSILLLFMCFMCMGNTVKAAEINLAPKAKTAVLIEAKTGTILFEKDKNIRLAPASMTKVMTLSIIFDYISQGKLDYEDVLETSEYASKMGGSQVYLAVGEKQTLDTLIKCICVASGNDAAVTVAERIAGSEAVFVSMMNDKAKELGLKNTNFTDCTGLNFKGHYTSAYDMAIMSMYLINNHPEVLKYTSIREDYIRQDKSNPFWLVNTNKLIGVYDYVDGLKTGWTEEAGYCLSATGKKNNMRLISVVMGYTSPTERNSESVEMLNYGFSNYEIVNILNQGTKIKECYNIKLSPSNVTLIAKEDVYIVKRINEELKEVNFDYRYDMSNERIINKEDVGYIDVYYGKRLNSTIGIIMYGEVKKNNFFEVFLEVIKNIFG